MKINKIVALIQRLQMIKSKSKFKASINHNNKELKEYWLKLSKEAEELLEIYNNSDIYDIKLADCYNQEWLLYAKMKTLNNTNLNSMDLKHELEKIHLFKKIIMTKMASVEDWEEMNKQYKELIDNEQ